MRSRLAAVAAAAVLVGPACSGGSDTIEVDDAAAAAADYSFSIPPGAGEAYDRGEPLEVLPATLDVRVGEVIEIVNDDDRGHLIGPFFVGAGETLRQRFRSPGTYVGVCTVHPSGELSLKVSAP